MSAFPRLGERQPVENRSRVIRMAILMTPITAIALGLVVLAVYQILGGQTGFIVTLLVFGVIAFLTLPMTIQYLKDLSAEPVEYQGQVAKKWQKGNLLIFLMPSFYVAMDTSIMTGRVTRMAGSGCYVSMEEGREGFVPRKEIGETASTVGLNPGQEVKYKVLGLDGSANYRLSIRRAEEYEVATRLFSVPRVEYAMLLEKDLIKVTCYPHSSTVERIERYDDVEKKFVPATDGATS